MTTPNRTQKELVMNSKSMRIWLLKHNIKEHEECIKDTQNTIDETYRKIDQMKNDIYDMEGNLDGDIERYERYKNELKLLEVQ